jgi:hypothetical protein
LTWAFCLCVVSGAGMSAVVADSTLGAELLTHEKPKTPPLGVEASGLAAPFFGRQTVGKDARCDASEWLSTKPELQTREEWANQR